jgi:hypothetical protein
MPKGSLAEALSTLSDQAQMAGEVRRLELMKKRMEAETERNRHLKEARLNEMLCEKFADLILVRSIHGESGADIANVKNLKKNALVSDRFSPVVPRSVIDKINTITLTSIPRLFQKIEETIDIYYDSLPKALSGIDSKLSTLSGMNLREAEAAFIQIIQTIDAYLRTQSDLTKTRFSFLEKLRPYIEGLTPRVSAIKSSYAAHLEELAIRAMASPDRLATSPVDNTPHLRKILQTQIPDLDWSEKSVSKIYLRIVFQASAQNISSLDAAQSIFSQGSLKIDEIEEIENLLIDEYEILNTGQISIFRNRLTRINNDFKILKERYERIRFECDMDLDPRIGEVIEECNVYQLETGDPRHTLFRSLLSLSGRKNLANLESVMTQAAARGKKSISLLCDISSSGFSLRHSSVNVMRFSGVFDFFLLVLNHPDGLGLGYESVPKKDGSVNLKLYWN